MNKLLYAVPLIFLFGCATPGEKGPLAARLCSDSGSVKSEAAKELKQLADGSKDRALADAAEYAQKEAERQEALVSALRQANEGGTLVYPLLRAAGGGTSPELQAKIIELISTSDPAPASELPKIRALLAGKDALCRKDVLAALGRMSMNASAAAPEVVAYMHREGIEKECYFAAIDALYRMDQGLAASWLAIDARDTAGRVGRMAVEKIIEVNGYIDRNMPATKAMKQALLAAALGADEALAEVAKKAVDAAGDRELSKQLEGAMAAGRSAVKSVLKLAGGSLNALLKSQERSAYEYAVKFYGDAGRADAARELQARMKDMGL